MPQLRSFRAPLRFTLALVLLAACTEGTTRPPGGDGGPGSDGGCAVGALVCDGAAVTRCEADGSRSIVETCAAPLTCAPGLGCVVCAPGARRCQGNAVELCRADASGWETEVVCAAEEVCGGSGPTTGCSNACLLADAERSNVGCEYYAVDLDNEWSPMSDAASQQLAVAIANPSDVGVQITVEQNDATLGATAAPRVIFTGTCPPRGVLEIPLPKREIDGSTDAGHNDGPGTFVSSRAYRVRSNFPVVAYQFNPIIQAFSNDASLLIPVSGLDTHYRVLGWPTANPIAPIPIAGVPDHSFVTIIGTEPGTEVRVRLGGPIVGGGTIPATAANGEIVYTLNEFDVLNLESDMVPGDLTGTVVESSHPVAVFSGGERGVAPLDYDAPEPPGGRPDSICCTDHLEEQVFPTSAWGNEFVITRSPQRATDWAEPDVYRVMADRERTTITTNLDGELASFTLEPGAWRQFYAQRSFVMRADHAVSIEQILVSQTFVGNARPGHGGDPSMLLFPPYEQYRNDYVFLTPTSFTADYAVLSVPMGAVVRLDGIALSTPEMMAACTRQDAGSIEGTTYQAVTCPMADGPHRVESDMPVGLMVYGYYNVGSYGYAGGSQLARINLI